MESFNYCPYCGHEVKKGFRFCGYCGKSIANETDSIESQRDEVEPLVETEKNIEKPATAVSETIEVEEMVIDSTRYNPTQEQTKMALYFVGAALLYLIILFVYWHKCDSATLIENYEKQADAFQAANRLFQIGSALYAVMMIVGYSLVSRLSSNRAVKFVTATGLILNVLMLVKFVVLTIYGGPENSLSPEMQKTISLIIQIHAPIDALLWVYLYSLIIQNNHLSVMTRSWISLLAILQVPQLVLSFSDLVAGGLGQNFIDQMIQKPEFWDELSYDDFFYYSNYWRLYGTVLCLITAIGCWHLFRSEAFTGEFREDVELNYSPLNRWMLMAVVVSAVAGVALYFFYIKYIPEHYLNFI